MNDRTYVNNQNGFGVVGFVALLPLIVAILAVISGASLLMKTDARLKHECRTSLLESQRKISDDLETLIKMNKGAASLRKQRTLADTAVKAARASKHPAAIALSEAALLTVKTAQGAFHSQQRFLIYKSRLASKSSPEHAGSKVIAGLRTEAKSNGDVRLSTRSRFRTASFELTETPKGDATPDYNPTSDFSVKQSMDVSVEIDVDPLLPEWLRKLLPAKGLTFKTQCTATIEKENKRWIEKLSAAR